MDDALLQEIHQGRIGAITLDTSVFDAQQLNLEAGLLRRVEQFHDRSITVVLPDVIAREVETHLHDRTTEARGQLQRALRLARQAGLLDGIEDDAVKSALGPHIASPDAAPDIARSRLAGWIARTGAVIVQTGEHVSVNELMQQYFSAQPPFALNGEKKHEFPDAVALLALESWAEAKQTKVIAISTDGDWLRFGAQSSRLRVVRDLGAALSAFQAHATLYACRRVVELLNNGDPLGLTAAVLKAIREQSKDKLLIEVRADVAPLDYQYAGMEVIVTGARLPGADEAYKFSAVGLYDGVLFVRVPVTAQLKIATSLNLYSRAAAGQPLAQTGTTRDVRSVDVELDMIVTLDGNIPERMKVKEVEVLLASHTLDLGRVTTS